MPDGLVLHQIGSRCNITMYVKVPIKGDKVGIGILWNYICILL